jgi:hypothetical protein
MVLAEQIHVLAGGGEFECAANPGGVRVTTSPPDKVLYWQGYAAALGAVMNAPSHLLDQARAVQEEQAERDGTMNDRVRVGLHDADPSV